MKLLLLSDTQTDRANLQESNVMLKHLLQVAHKEKPDFIIHAGDVKESYDPISLVVVKWWVKAIKKIVSRGHRFLVLKGNHDRISQSAESVDWLDILAAAGAEVVTKPTVLESMAFLPYSGNVKQEVEWADELSQQKASVLIFHTAVAEGMANGGFSGLGNTAETLHFDKYKACFGGHYHMHQKVGKRAWYVGSPFCHDWGEANEPKGFLLATIGNQSIQVKRIPSRIPGWYDSEWLVKHGVEPEENAYIRSRVPVTSKKISQQIQQEEKRLRELYPTARLYVMPRLLETEKEGGFELTGTTDREKVAQYVAATWPEGARFKPGVVVSYLAGILKQAGQGPSNHQIKALQVAVRNVLSFEEAIVPLTGQGLVVIRGENRDWGPGVSNGSGKTGLLSFVLLALYGKNLKGQVHDAWAREGTDKGARVTFTFSNEKKQKIEVERTRRPHGLFLRIDDEDMSTGLKGTGKNETQGEIERHFTDYHTFVNSTFIDQSIANSFLYGTQKDRMDLMNKIVSMERYEIGQKQIGKELTKSFSLMAAHSSQIVQLEEMIEHYQTELKSLEVLVETNWAKKQQEADEALQALQQEHTAIAAVGQTYTALQEELDEETVEIQRFNLKLAALKANLSHTETAKFKAIKQMKNKICPTCGQEVPAKVGQAEVDELQGKCKELQQQIHKISSAKSALAEKVEQKTNKIWKFNSKLNKLQIELDYARKSLVYAEEGAKEEAKKNQVIKAKQQAQQQQLQQYQLRVSVLQRVVKRMTVDIEMLEYAKKAFQRTGMPLMLCRTTCQLLNKAAEFYSELFFGGKQGVRFAVTESEFVVETVNGVGSETILGQSTGEGAMAGIIAALALREACPKSNLLIMDEPGHGLDPVGAKAFAQGLIKLKKHFATILVTTHNTAIAAELSSEKTWTVIKENGMSQLVKQP